ncbi:4942_t:CDS:2, partial [Rhizophagus irregularis]
PEDVFKSSFLKLPGCVPVDVCTCFKKLYSRSEVEKGSSLKFYLKLCGLDSKADMSFNRLWKFYSNAIEQFCKETARNIHEVVNYYALRYQELVVKRNVINDYREVALIAYVFLFDAHYQANGMKHDSVQGERKGKIPWSIRFPPKKEKIILNQEEADIVGKRNRLHKIEFSFNGRTLRAWSVQHDNCSEKKELYPTVLEDLFNKRACLK